MALSLEQGRAAYAAGAWTRAFQHLLAARDEGALDGDGWDRLGEVAHLVGHDEHTGRAWEHAHLAHRQAGNVDRAARSAFWLALWLLLQGEHAPASGWLGRARALLDECEVDGAGRGYLLVTASMDATAAGDAAHAEALGGEAAEIGRRFDDRDLWALGRLTTGEAVLSSGDVGRGMAILDELMVAATLGELSPIATGIVYCAVIEACMHALDVGRAAEWTDALTRWCADQPGLVPFRGQCLVHRAQVLHARGEWEAAASEAAGADRLLADPPHPARALASYVLGDLHRLRGSFDAAESAYRQANSLGYPPVPGMALLRLAQGRADDAVVGIRRALEEVVDRAHRPAVLAAAVDIYAASGAVDDATAAAAELEALAGDGSPPVLQAMADHSRGTAALAAGDCGAALVALRRACSRWLALDMPYEAARVRVALARACGHLGDRDGADAELDSARAVFARLGAAPDLALATPRVGGDHALSARELDVLALVADGRTNREIGTTLGISEHTVARHLQNTFAKLGVSSRAAAVATAFERQLL